ncbi:unnamed protein product [Amoebophrya sp. A120]|nr:unnamed protein product [Amoebophrya sp. A120]|eukprot:GSA120T00022110001.1
MSTGSASSSSSSSRLPPPQFRLPWANKNSFGTQSLQDFAVPETLTEHLIMEHVAGFVIKYGEAAEFRLRLATENSANDAARLSASSRSSGSGSSSTSNGKVDHTDTSKTTSAASNKHSQLAFLEPEHPLRKYYEWLKRTKATLEERAPHLLPRGWNLWRKVLPSESIVNTHVEVVNKEDQSTSSSADDAEDGNISAFLGAMMGEENTKRKNKRHRRASAGEDDESHSEMNGRDRSGRRSNKRAKTLSASKASRPASPSPPEAEDVGSMFFEDYEDENSQDWHSAALICGAHKLTPELEKAIQGIGCALLEKKDRRFADTALRLKLDESAVLVRDESGVFISLSTAAQATRAAAKAYFDHVIGVVAKKLEAAAQQGSLSSLGGPEDNYMDRGPEDNSTQSAQELENESYHLSAQTAHFLARVARKIFEEDEKRAKRAEAVEDPFKLFLAEIEEEDEERAVSFAEEDVPDIHFNIPVVDEQEPIGHVEDAAVVLPEEHALETEGSPPAVISQNLVVSENLIDGLQDEDEEPGGAFCSIENEELRSANVVDTSEDNGAAKFGDTNSVDAQSVSAPGNSLHSEELHVGQAVEEIQQAAAVSSVRNTAVLAHSSASVVASIRDGGDSVPHVLPHDRQLHQHEGEQIGINQKELPSTRLHRRLTATGSKGTAPVLKSEKKTSGMFDYDSGSSDEDGDDALAKFEKR